MATEDDLEKAEAKDEVADEAPGALPQANRPERELTEDELEAEKAGKADDAAREAASSPVQLGYMRFVYAAYMGGAILVSFLVAKIAHVSWHRLGQWKPELGEPQDEVVYLVAGLVGAAVAFFYWRKVGARQYAIDVAEELSKVTWPSRKEVTNSTTVVLFYTIFATVFFALMDQFWKYVTDKIYSF
jgi:preprotein translocase subunit SecE